MKKWLKKTSLLLFLSNTVLLLYGQSDTKCCDNAGCRTAAMNYAVKMAGLAEYLPRCTGDPIVNKNRLDSLKQANNAVYNELMKVAKEIHNYFYAPKTKFRKDGCFVEALPDINNNRSNIQLWVAYIGGLGKKIRFSSAEFCPGLKLRAEIGQGATDISKRNTGYLGSLRAFLVYTPGKKDDCGKKIRIMAGPGMFLRGSTNYIALSSRVAYRLKDINPAFFPIGNLNLFAEYSSSFGNLSYGAVGAEVELGFLGFNISGNNNMKTGRKGFAVDVFYRF